MMPTMIQWNELNGNELLNISLNQVKSCDFVNHSTLQLSSSIQQKCSNFKLTFASKSFITEHTIKRRDKKQYLCELEKHQLF